MQGDYNAIVVGWEGSSQQIWYPQSASDTRTVGTEIGLVAENVIANGNSARSRLYCVGHSLGSHVCGHAGMKTKFGRITGTFTFNCTQTSVVVLYSIRLLYTLRN